MKNLLEKVFKLKEKNTNVRTEVLAGVTTFLTMAYILAVNPSILSDAGMDPTAVLLATCLASFIGTALMSFMANLPFALSAGMGLNAYFAYTVVGNLGYPWQVALLAVFVEGIIFIILSLTKVREAIFNAIPPFATAPALIVVGFLMFTNVSELKLTSENYTSAIPAYLCIIAMPLFYSIAEGISVGIISYVLINLICKKGKGISPIMYVLAVLFILKYIFL